MQQLYEEKQVLEAKLPQKKARKLSPERFSETNPTHLSKNIHN